MRSKDPTAYIPVIQLRTVPAGPLQSRCIWARRFRPSRVEVEGIDPHR
jgi:hypothetical protein